MRVLIATGIYPPDIGGPATYSALLARELPKRNTDVSVVTYGPAGVSRKIPKGLRHLAYFCICYIKALSADIVFAQDPVSAGLPALCAARLARRVFALRVAGDYAWEQATQRYGVTDSIDEFQTRSYSPRVERLRRLQRFVVRHADLAITPSKYFQNIVRGWFAARIHADLTRTHAEGKPNVITIYNGIEFSEVRPPQTETSILGRSDLKKIIFSAGRLVPWKGFDVLIEMMKDLPEWELRIAGEGPQREALERAMRNEKAETRVELLGAIAREKMGEELARARVFVLNTSFESFSYQVVEAMWAGVPVVATNIGNLSEIIENGKEGILAAPNDKAALIAAILRLDEDEGFRAEVIKAAREKAKQFSLQHTIDELVPVFKSLLKQQ